MPDEEPADRPRVAYCSFCRRAHTDAGPLVEGPDRCYICYRCARLCARTIEEEYARCGIPPPAPPT